MTPLGAVHTAFAFIAIAAGAVVLMMQKGTRWHRTWGHVYVTALAASVVIAFLLYNLTGRVGPFHVAALVGGGTLAAGLFSVLARRPKKQWIEAHAIWMSWSYIGLMAAFAAESLTRFVMPWVAPFLEERSMWGAFWTSVGVSSFAVCGVGWWLVKTRLPQTIRNTRDAMRRERRALRELADESGVEAGAAAGQS